MGLYIVANIDGNIISSTDGLEWSAPYNTGITGINKVAIGPSKIVYSLYNFGGLFHASNWNDTPVLSDGTIGKQFEEVRYLGGKFVAVGRATSGSGGFIPAFAYSENGEIWTVGAIDQEFIAEIGSNIRFTDVGYNGTGYFIVGILNGEGKAGAFYTTDLSQQLNEGNYVTPENFPTDAGQLVYAPYPEGGENFGAWSALELHRGLGFGGGSF
jgi:hypothetical protein